MKNARIIFLENNAVNANHIYAVSEVMKTVKFIVFFSNIREYFNISMFDSSYNPAVLANRKKYVAFILTKLILNIALYLSYDYIHKYKGITIFCNTTRPKTSLMNAKGKK